MALATPTPDGGAISRYAVVFGLFPGSHEWFHTIERDADSGGSPAGSPETVAVLAPGTRHFIDVQAPKDTFFHYRARHSGFGRDPGVPTAWHRAKAEPWDGELPNIPREPLLDLDLALDDATGNVSIVANGRRRVGSIEWGHTMALPFPADPSTAVNTDAEGDVTVTDAFTLTAGQTGFVTVQFFDGLLGAGRLLGTLRQSITHGSADPDTTFGTLVLNGDFEHETDGAYWTDAVGSGSVAIETGSPVLGSKSLKVTSAAGGATTVAQSNTSAGFATNSTTTRRLIPVEPGETFEVRVTGKGQGDHPVLFQVSQFNDAKASSGPQTLATFTSSTATAAIVQYTVPSAVYYIRWRVQVDADASAPRDYFIDSITPRRIDTTDTGIPTELSVGGIYYISEVEIVPDSSGGVEGSDPGFLYWGGADWRYIHPNGSKHFVLADSVTLVSLDGTRANTADLMCFVGFDQSRFTGLADFHMRRIVGVRKSRSAGWQYLGDSGWLNFTPNTSDGLLAEPVLTSEVV